MVLDPWYKVALPRKEIREGRSFNPDEFAIALEQVVAGTAPKDYTDPVQFFDRTSFTRALHEHAGMVLRRLAGKTENSAPVLTLITQFGGGKTHTLTSLYHLIHRAKKVANHDGVKALVKAAGLSEVPKAKVAVFVGNAGTRRRAARHRGSISSVSWPATPEWRRLALRQGPHRRVRRPSGGWWRQPAAPCSCCSTKC
ncbi:MAG: hypothetical protein NZM29_06340 [Nitrospira sp.]|nr:hypothetical protein [Nitrospira sp.]